MGTTAISTWFVADNAAEATYFPQLGTRSDAPAAQAAYWRCALVFFATSVRLNPGRTHLFFTNTDVPRVDGIDLAAAFADWGVEVVRLPITYRLPRGEVSSWGNQFYIFDILAWFEAHGQQDRLIVLDSDCVWRHPADRLEAAIDARGVLTYVLGEIEYPVGADINGLSREGMARFAGRGAPVPYCGGELFAGTLSEVRRLAEQVPALWARMLAGEADAPREEAHLLSVLYAANDYALGTSNPFVRRMWTTFKHRNLRPSDRDITIWHLPAEKKTGFADLFGRLRDGGIGALDDATVARLMGYPRRAPRKLVRDLALKIREKLG